MSIQINGSGASVADIQSGLATAAALAALAASVERQVSVNAPNHIAVIADMSSATWNTVGTHEVFTVTGAVRMRIWVESTVLTSEEDNSAWMSLGDEANPASIILSGGIDGSVLGFWNSSSGYVAIGFYSAAIFDFVLNGLDIGYGITLYPLLSGTLIFHCVWEPLSAGAMVLPGAGGPL